MREGIAYREMQEEMAQERGSRPPSPDPTMEDEASPSAANPGGQVDPARKQRAYPDLPNAAEEP